METGKIILEDKDCLKCGADLSQRIKIKLDEEMICFECFMNYDPVEVIEDQKNQALDENSDLAE